MKAGLSAGELKILFGSGEVAVLDGMIKGLRLGSRRGMVIRIE